MEEKINNNRVKTHNKDVKYKPQDKYLTDWNKQVIYIKYISSGNSGGRKFRYAVFSIVGKENKIGLGYGKANTTTEALKKSFTHGIKNAETFSFSNASTVPFFAKEHYHSGKLMLKPIYNGAGLKCNFVTRVILKMLGIKNVSSKAYGTRHKLIKALVTIKLLRKIERIHLIQKTRLSNYDIVN